MRKLLVRLALVLSLILLPAGPYGDWAHASASAPSSSASYKWDNVAIGGGGYVTGLVIHPTTPDLVYARTDVGGAYRWDPVRQSWVQLMNSVSYEDKNLYGIDGIAVDPSDDQVVYVAAGINNNGSPSDILKSTDRGMTWTRTNLNKKFWANGNNERSYGEPIAVNPGDSNQILVGTRYNGIWKSVNGASATGGSGSATDANNWTQAIGVPPDAAGKGVRSIVFKDAHTAYAGVIGYGVYESVDGGSNWSLMAGSPVSPRRMQWSADGSVLYVTHEVGVAKYAAGVWTTITPPTSLHLNKNSALPNYNGLTVDPLDPDHLVVARRAAVVPEDIFRSVDGGATWVNLNKSFQVNHSSPWWNAGYLAGALSSLTFDPHAPGRIWMTDWLGIYRTEDVTQAKVVWTTYTKGHEEMVPFDLISPPIGANLLAAYADNDGMRHDDLTQFPLKKFGNPALSETTSLDYVEADPSYIVRVGGYNLGNRGSGASSSDGGQTWTEFADYPRKSDDVKYANGNVAVSATNPQVIVTTPLDSLPMRSADGGATWSVVSGVPVKVRISFWNWGDPVAADRIDGDVFYIFSGGRFYRSEDGGANWEIVNDTVPQPVPGTTAYLKAAPGKTGEVWIASGGNGLYRTTDGGDTFTKQLNVQEAILVGFGKAAPGTNIPAVYLYGKADGAARIGIYRSDDLGATWVRINDDQHLIGNNVRNIEGDRQVYGRVYVTTDGTGIWYGEPETPAEADIQAPAAPTSVEVTEQAGPSLTLSWTPSADPDILHYVIYDGDEIIALASGDAASAVIRQVQPGETYDLRVAARDTSWNRSPVSEPLIYTVGVPLIALDTPSGTTVEGQNYTLTGRVSLPAHIRVKQGDVVVAGTDTSLNSDGVRHEFQLTVPLAEGVNEFVIEAEADGGAKGSVAWTIHTPPVIVLPPAAPVVSVAGKTETSLTLSWDAVDDPYGAVSYEVRVNGTLSADAVNVSGAVYSTRITGLTAGTTYSFVVTAIDPAGNRSDSQTVDASTLAYSTSYYPVYAPVQASRYPAMPERMVPAGAAIKEAAATADKQAGLATYVMTFTEYEQLLSKAEADAAGLKTIVLKMPVAEGVQEYVLSLPSEIFAGTAGAGADVVVSTEFGVFRFPAELLHQTAIGDARKVDVSIRSMGQTKLADDVLEQAKERLAVQLQMSANGKTVRPTGRGEAAIEAALPYTPAQGGTAGLAKQLAIIVLDDTGEAVRIAPDAYDDTTGMLMFTAGRPGIYAIAQRQTKPEEPKKPGATQKPELPGSGERFGDLTDYAWAKGPIEALAALGIIQGTGPNAFTPAAHVTRADFTLMMVRALALEGEGQSGSGFDDVHAADYYYEAVGIAKTLGIVQGRGDGAFSPLEPITRQEMMVIIARALKVAGKLDSSSAEAVASPDIAGMSEVAPYAVDDITHLVNKGIIEGSDAGLQPLKQATRAEAAVMLYRIYNQ